VEHEVEDPPADFEVFRKDAEYARDDARAHGELDALRTVIDSVLANDGSFLEKTFHLSLAGILNTENSQPERYLRQLLAFYREVIWPDAEPIRPGQPPDVELVHVPLEEWRRERDASR